MNVIFFECVGMRLLSWTVRENEARPGQPWATRNLATQAGIVHVVARGQNRHMTMIIVPDGNDGRRKELQAVPSLPLQLLQPPLI